MTDHVDETLRLWRSTPLAWGYRDCMLSIGDYIASRGGLDVAARFRGMYADEAGAMAFLAAYGGVEGLIDLTGLTRTDEPARGDVVALDTGLGQVGALCTGPGIAARLERGVIEIERRFINVSLAWRVL